LVSNLSKARPRLPSGRATSAPPGSQLQVSQAAINRHQLSVQASRFSARPVELGADIWAAAERAARGEAEGLRQQFGESRIQAATAEARAREIEKCADDLNAELARVNQHSSDLVAALTAQPAAAAKAPTAPKSAG
jgi:hypothetical protein